MGREEERRPLVATLKLSPDARDKLRALKRGGESYDAVIRRLMKEAED